MSLETVFSSFSSAEAQLVSARLEAAGFHPVVTDEIASMSMEGYSMATGGIRINVPEEEKDPARALVESLLEASSEDANDPSTTTE